MWHSLVARIVRDDEAAGSNPVIPTTFESKAACEEQAAFLWFPIDCARKNTYYNHERLGRVDECARTPWGKDDFHDKKAAPI